MSNKMTDGEIATLQAAGIETGPGQNLRTHERSAGAIPASALPPDSDPDYAARMVAKGGGEPRPKTMTSTDYAGSLPAASALQGWSSAGNSRAPSQLRPGDSFTYLGTKVEVEQGLTLGLIERDPAGGYRAISAVDQNAAKAQEARTTREEATAAAQEIVTLRAEGEEPSAETQAIINNVVANADSASVDGAIQEFISTGDVSVNTLAQLGHSMGISPAEAATTYNQTFAGLRQQADTVARLQGVNPDAHEALWAWAEQFESERHSRAVGAFLRSGETSGLKVIAKSYLAHLRQTS